MRMDFPIKEWGRADPEDIHYGYFWDGFRWDRSGTVSEENGGGGEPIEEYQYHANFITNQYSHDATTAAEWLSQVSGATYNRPTQKWVLQNGLMVRVAPGTNLDGAVSDRGLVLDPASVNFPTTPEGSWNSTSWPAVGLTGTVPTSMAGQGPTTATGTAGNAWQFNLATGTGVKRAARAFTTTADQNATVALILRRIGTVRYVAFSYPTSWLPAPGSGFADYAAWSIFDLEEGLMVREETIGNTAYAHLGSGIEEVGNGWWRCWMNGDRTGGQIFALSKVDSDGPLAPSNTQLLDGGFIASGTSGDAIQMWGVQAESRLGPTSLIFDPSGTGSPRAADVLNLPVQSASEVLVDGAAPDADTLSAITGGTFGSTKTIATIAWNP